MPWKQNIFLSPTSCSLSRWVHCFFMVNLQLIRFIVLKIYLIKPKNVSLCPRLRYVYDKSILNDWPIQKIDLLTSTLGTLCNIFICLIHAVPTCKRVTLMVKVWSSVLIYQTFRAFKEAMKWVYLIWGNNDKVKFWKLIIFKEF